MNAEPKPHEKALNLIKLYGSINLRAFASDMSLPYASAKQIISNLMEVGKIRPVKYRHGRRWRVEYALSALHSPCFFCGLSVPCDCPNPEETHAHEGCLKNDARRP